MPEITLTQGQVTVVDDADYEWLSQWKWFASWTPNVNAFYAARNAPAPKRGLILMHRVILGLTSGACRGDHVNRNTLDNRRINLRRATPHQNQCNQRLRKDNTSGYKGVTYDKRKSKWMVKINTNHVSKFGGYYATASEAALAYDTLATMYHGDFATLNFPQGGSV